MTSSNSLSFLDKTAASVLDQLTEGLDLGDSRKHDRERGFMPVHVEHLHDGALGALFSVAHYYEQNGDLVPDPDVVFVRHADGWSPLSFQDARAYREAVTFQEDGTIEVNAREQRRLAVFCNLWMRNIQEQQALPARVTR